MFATDEGDCPLQELRLLTVEAHPEPTDGQPGAMEP